MNNILIFAAIVIFGLIPFGFGVIYVLYKRTIVFTAATTVFLASMFTGIVAFSVNEIGFISLIWAIPLCLVFLVSMNAVFKKKIQKQLIKLNEILTLISKGVLNVEIPQEILDNKNELGKVAQSLNTTLKGLHNTSGYAKEIAKGNFNIEYDLLSKDDEIGHALINMKKSLVEAAEIETKRKEEEKRQTYITNGIAEFSTLLRSNSDNMNKMSMSLMSKLVDYVGAVQGAIFVANELNDEVIYELTGTVAYDRRKKLEKQFRVGEGLVGRCAFEKLPIFLKDVPENYVNITSGLGEANPKCIIMVPAISEGKVLAVIELASFTVFDDYKVTFIEKLGDDVASVIANVRNNENTRILLEESKKNSEEMAAQEEELRQNIEELTATQEEMRRKEAELNELAKKLEMHEREIAEKTNIEENE